MSGGGVVLADKRDDGDRRHRVDAAVLQLQERVGEIERHRAVAQRLHDLHLSLAARRGDENPKRLEIRRGHRGLARKEPHPSRVGPKERDVSLREQALVEIRTQLVADVLGLVERSKEHRNFLQGGNSRVDLRDAAGRQHSRLQLADIHPANDIGLAALIAARIDDEVHLAVRSLSPRVSHLPKDSVVGRVLGRRRGEFDPHPRVGADSHWIGDADDSERQWDENA